MDGRWTQQMNRVTNPSFELSATGWVGARANVQKDTTRSRYGTASAKLTVTDASSWSYLISTINDRAHVTGGERVTMCASVWTAAQEVFQMQLYEYDSTGELLLPVLQAPANPTLAGQWTDMKHNFTVKPNATSVRLLVIKQTNATLGAEYWADAISLGTTAYLDGDMPGCAWTGAPHASTSIGRRRR